MTNYRANYKRVVTLRASIFENTWNECLFEIDVDSRSISCLLVAPVRITRAHRETENNKRNVNYDIRKIYILVERTWSFFHARASFFLTPQDCLCFWLDSIGKGKKRKRKNQREIDEEFETWRNNRTKIFNEKKKKKRKEKRPRNSHTTFSTDLDPSVARKTFFLFADNRLTVRADLACRRV